MKERHIRCILFDLGSTLWRRKDHESLLASEQTANAIALSTLRHLPHSEALFPLHKDELGTLLRKTVERHLKEKKRLDREHEPDFALVTMEALHALGMRQADHQAGAVVFEALRMRIPQTRILFDDTRTTLAALKERGYRLGVVTNRHYGGRRFYEDLDQMGILDYIAYETMAISADLGVRKPHADIFMHALKALGAAPEEAAMVGDSLRADIVGAKKLHLLAVWKPKASVRANAMATFHAASSSVHEHKKSSSPEPLNPAQDPVDLQTVQELQEPLDEYLLSWAFQRGEHLTPAQRDLMTPDVIIKDLGDLLALFD